MGRHRQEPEGDAGMVIRLLDWCGKNLAPIPLAPREDLERIGFDWIEHQRIRADKITYHDQSEQGESDTPRVMHRGKVNLS